jgi:type IV secretory pathway TrbF-like protein
MSIQSTALQSTIANIYVSSGNTVVSVAYFCNTDTTARLINVWLQPASTAGIAANANVQIYNNIQLASGDTYVMDWEKLVLGSGDMIRANASGAVTATVSYVGI